MNYSNNTSPITSKTFPYHNRVIWIENNPSTFIDEKYVKWLVTSSVASYDLNNETMNHKLYVDITHECSSNCIITASVILRSQELLDFLNKTNTSYKDKNESIVLSNNNFGDSYYYGYFIPDCYSKTYYGLPTFTYDWTISNNITQSPTIYINREFDAVNTQKNYKTKTYSKNKNTKVKPYVIDVNRMNNIHTFVSFSNCPLDLFHQYWNIPIYLNSALRSYGEDEYKTITALTLLKPSREVIKTYGRINSWFASYTECMVEYDDLYNNFIKKWLQDNVKSKIFLLSDYTSIFTDPEEEFLFSADWR
jgi:hypothetical protein